MHPPPCRFNLKHFRDRDARGSKRGCVMSTSPLHPMRWSCYGNAVDLATQPHGCGYSHNIRNVLSSRDEVPLLSAAVDKCFDRIFDPAYGFLQFLLITFSGEV